MSHLVSSVIPHGAPLAQHAMDGWQPPTASLRSGFRYRQTNTLNRCFLVHFAVMPFLGILLAGMACAAQAPPPETPRQERTEAQAAAPQSAQAPSPCTDEKPGAASPASADPASAPPPPTSSQQQPACPPGPAKPKLPLINWYARFTTGPQVKPLTPREKAWLAVRNVADPFNALTILGSSAIAVGANAHSPVGPGMTGFGKDVGISYSQDLTGEFFGTFLIPSIVHQDPHYHRLPGAPIPRRIAHTIYQVAWTQGDNGKGMVNYADLVGFALDDAIGNLYVPGRDTDLSASAARYFTGLATAPIDNVITEFLPDVARRIHVRVVIIQRIINHVARMDATNGTP